MRTWRNRTNRWSRGFYRCDELRTGVRTESRNRRNESQIHENKLVWSIWCPKVGRDEGRGHDNSCLCCSHFMLLTSLTQAVWFSSSVLRTHRTAHRVFQVRQNCPCGGGGRSLFDPATPSDQPTQETTAIMAPGCLSRSHHCLCWSVRCWSWETLQPGGSVRFGQAFTLWFTFVSYLKHLIKIKTQVCCKFSENISVSLLRKSDKN